ncbi:MAG: HAD family hydrolase [Acidimicrobiales bacterium]
MTETLVITDLDGSFWGRDLRCHPTTLDAVAELDRRGVPLLVATGRREGSAKRGLAGNGLSRPAVLLNGALGIDLPTDTRFHSHPFTEADARAVVDSLAEIAISPIAYPDDGTVRGSPDATTGPLHREGFGDDYRAEEPSTTVASSSILSFGMIGMPRHEVEPAVAALADVAADVMLYEDHLHQAWSVHIQPARISKWNGIQSYLDYAGLRPERIVAIGDGTNDLEMLANADLSIAVAGGHVEVLDMADHVVDHPEHGGWRSVLDHL